MLSNNYNYACSLYRRPQAKGEDPKRRWLVPSLAVGPAGLTAVLFWSSKVEGSFCKPLTFPTSWKSQTTNLRNYSHKRLLHFPNIIEWLWYSSTLFCQYWKEHVEVCDVLKLSFKSANRFWLRVTWWTTFLLPHSLLFSLEEIEEYFKHCFSKCVL